MAAGGIEPSKRTGLQAQQGVQFRHAKHPAAWGGACGGRGDWLAGFHRRTEARPLDGLNAPAQTFDDLGPLLDRG